MSNLLEEPRIGGPRPVPFDKYESMGPYHWREADPASRDYNPPLEARYRIVLELAREIAAKHRRILDIGCGDGYLMNLLSPLADTVIGIDSEGCGAALAKSQLAAHANCSVIQASGCGLPFKDESFDLATCTDVIEHLRQPDALLSEARRILRPGGHLLLTTPQWRAERVWDARHFKEYTPDEMGALLQESFSRVRLQYFWPMKWSRIYSTRIGWRLIPHFCRFFFNPFLARGQNPDKFGQVLAVCVRGS